jgi:putative PIG3 family NAD(P)H quinone oxidoreductase
MQAIVIVQRDRGASPELREVADPVPGPSDLLVAVRAAGLNRADLAARPYHYGHAAPTSGPPIGGLEMAGEVIGIGADVSAFRVGDRVMAMAAGSYAEMVAVHHRLAIPVPDALSWDEAAATPVAFVTAHDALVANAGLAPEESLLVHAVTSGVGVAAVQIARLMGARPILGTSGSRDKLRVVTKFGLDVGIDYRNESFGARALEATAGRGVDVVLDMVGGSALAGNLECMATRGRLVQIGRLTGAVAELNLDVLALKRLHLIGVTFRTRSLPEHAAVVQRFADDLLPALTTRRLIPLVDRVFPLAEARAALEHLRSSAHVGKIVLRV